MCDAEFTASAVAEEIANVQFINQINNTNVSLVTVGRRKSHISPYFTIIVINRLKRILAFSLKLLSKLYLNFIDIKE